MTITLEIAATKKPATVTFKDSSVVISDKNGCLIQATNDRGNFEILLAPDTMHLRDNILASKSGTLSGFFRRRSSGFQADGSRHYIWTFCATNLENTQETMKKAA